MNVSNASLYDSFQSKKIIKIITGIDKTNISQVIKIAMVAQLSGGSYLDVVANPKIVKVLKSMTYLPICVSSVSPIDLYNCVVAGADLIEIGNFDTFYKKGIYLTARQILHLAKEIKFLLNGIDCCVTIPYYIPISEQIKLAQDLEFIGVNIIQTESLFIKNKSYILNLNIDNTVYSINSSYLSLLSTYFISKHVSIPIITSSSMNNLSGVMALLFGASGIGVGSIIRNHGNLVQMSNYLRFLRESIDLINPQMLASSLSCFSNNLLYLNKTDHLYF